MHGEYEKRDARRESEKRGRVEKGEEKMGREEKRDAGEDRKTGNRTRRERERKKKEECCDKRNEL